jgi:hypothetical protein
VALENFVQLYDILLRKHYIMAHQALENAQDVRQLSHFIGQIFRLVDKSYQMQKTSEIPFFTIDELLDKAGESQLLPYGLSAGALKKAYRVMILRG